MTNRNRKFRKRKKKQQHFLQIFNFEIQKHRIHSTDRQPVYRIYTIVKWFNIAI